MNPNLFFTLDRQYYHSTIPTDLNNPTTWTNLISDVATHVNHFFILSNQDYKHSYGNKLFHYINSPDTHWSIHFLHLMNHQTEELYSQIPNKIINNRHFQNVYKRNIKKVQGLQPSTFINYNKIKYL